MSKGQRVHEQGSTAVGYGKRQQPQGTGNVNSRTVRKASTAVLCGKCQQPYSAAGTALQCGRYSPTVRPVLPWD